MTDQQPRFGWLDAAVVAVSVLCIGIVAAAGVASSSILLLVGTLAVFVAAWFAIGKEAECTGRRWLPMLVVLVVTCAIGTVIHPAFATFQLIAFSLAWFLTPGIRAGIAASIAVATAVGVPYGVRVGVVEAAAIEGISLAFSLAMGIWISRIEDRSRGRQALVDELTAAQAKIAVLSREAGSVEERERLARDLHDTLTQSLSGIVMLAERAAARHPDDAMLGVLQDAARQALGEARAIVAGGANVPLDHGLADALTTLAERFRRETGLRVDLDVAAEVPRGLEVVLLRCAQEALANVRKHARASAVTIVLHAADGAATLTVTDDGDGPGGGTGFGLSGMRDRLALVDGDVDLAAAPGRGARLTVRAPLHAGVQA